MVLERLKDIIYEVLNISPSDIYEDSKFNDDLKADSIDIAQILVGIENEFGITIDEDEVEEIETVGDAVERIESKLNQ